MIALTYTSRAEQTMSAFDLIDLLRSARDRNLQVGVTGLLLYAQESFLQQLEGEPEVVDAVFERIRADARHSDIRIVSQDEISERRYANWAMGFAFPEPERLAEVLPGYEPRFQAPFADRALVDGPTAQLLLAMLAADADADADGDA